MASGHEDTFHHVRDFPYFELPAGERFTLPELPIPSPEKLYLYFTNQLPKGQSIIGLQLTKYMVLQVVAGLLVLLIARGLAKRAAGGKPVRGRFWNFWESLAVFIRDQVVRPTIGTGHHHDDHGDDHAHGDSHAAAAHATAAHGAAPAVPAHSLTGHAHKDHAHKDHAHKDHTDGATGGIADVDDPHGAGAVPSLADTGSHRADQYLPFVWSCFFYVLFCNLLGAIPMMGSATAEISVTVALALCTVGAVIVAGTRESGFVGFWKSLAPSMDLPGPIKIVLVPMIWVIELIGFVIKHGVLAVRLFANIMAGHTVIAVILTFIAIAAEAQSAWLYYLVVPASIFGQIAIGMLELLVAFLQAYIFAFLASLFISAAVNPH